MKTLAHFVFEGKYGKQASNVVLEGYASEYEIREAIERSIGHSYSYTIDRIERR